MNSQNAFAPYLAVQLAVALGGGGFLLLKGEALAGWLRALFLVLVLLTLLSVSAFFGRRRWAAGAEGVRTFVIACVFAALAALGFVTQVQGAVGYVFGLVSLGACITLASTYKG